MESLLTVTIAAIIILFTVSAAADFTAGLVKLWQDAGSKAQPRIETKPAIEQPAIANQVEPVSVLPDLWMQSVEEVAFALPTEQPSVKPQLLLPPAALQIATLEWTLRNLPPVEIYAIEIPDAIAMAKSKLPKTAPVIELATKAQLQSSGIRKLKQLAREIKLSGYGNMRVAQLADALEGKVAAHQLVA